MASHHNDIYIIDCFAPAGSKVTPQVFCHFDSKMTYIQKLITFFCQATAPHNPAIQTPNILLKLPAEILKQIANNLPAGSAASFSLSCRNIYFLIRGALHLQKLDTSSYDTLAFLGLLEHDFPDQIVYNFCRKFHKINNAYKYAENGYRVFPRPTLKGLNCYEADSRASVTYWIHENFNSTLFKMTMKHYHHFSYDAQTHHLLNCLSGKPLPHYGEYISQKEDGKSRIKDGSLFTHKKIVFRGSCSGVVKGIMYRGICRHVQLETKEGSLVVYITSCPPRTSEEMWSLILSCNNRSTEKKSWGLGTMVQQCQYCRTEYEIRFEHVNNCAINNAQYLEGCWERAWSEEWNSHIEYVTTPRLIQFKRGQIKYGFEEGAAEGARVRMGSTCAHGGIQFR